jgi:putative endonuclease
MAENHNQKVGQIGEKQARDFLQAQNHQILAQNYHSRFGEIDIISINLTKPRKIIFTEVKTRIDISFGHPEESLTYQKKQRLFKTAIDYLTKNNLKTSWRIDLIAIQLDKSQKLLDLRHYKNVFHV